MYIEFVLTDMITNITNNGIVKYNTQSTKRI